MNEQKSKIIEIIRIKGPVIPNDIANVIGVDLLFSSAILSELVSDKTLQPSHLKIGSSPLYFMPEQKHLLERFADHLEPKEKKVFERLKKDIILNDEKLEPAERVAIREIKDFAVPVKVVNNNKEYLFWKIYSSPANETEEKIRNALGIEEIKPKLKAEKKEAKPRAKKQEMPEEKETAEVKPEIKPEIKEARKRGRPRKKKEDISPPSPPSSPAEKLEKEAEKIEKIVEVIEKKEEIMKDEQKEVEEVKKEIEEIMMKAEKPKEAKAAVAADAERKETKINLKAAAFREKMLEFAQNNSMGVVEEKLSESREMSFIASINSDIGALQYLVIAKDKKAISESDLSLAFSEGQSLRMPVLLITNGKLTAKGKEYAQGLKGQLIFREMGKNLKEQD